MNRDVSSALRHVLEAILCGFYVRQYWRTWHRRIIQASHALSSFTDHPRLLEWSLYIAWALHYMPGGSSLQRNHQVINDICYAFIITRWRMHTCIQTDRSCEDNPLRTHGSRTHCGIVTTLYLLSCRGSSSIPASLLQYLGADREQDPRSGNFGCLAIASVCNGFGPTQRAISSSSSSSFNF